MVKKLLILNFVNVEVTNQEIRDAALIAVTYGINKENIIKDVAVEKKITPQFFSETVEE